MKQSVGRWDTAGQWSSSTWRGPQTCGRQPIQKANSKNLGINSEAARSSVLNGWMTSRATEFKTKTWSWSKCLQGSRASWPGPLVAPLWRAEAQRSSSLRYRLTRRAAATCNSGSLGHWCHNSRTWKHSDFSYPEGTCCTWFSPKTQSPRCGSRTTRTLTGFISLHLNPLWLKLQSSVSGAAFTFQAVA